MGRTNWNRPRDRLKGRETERIDGGSGVPDVLRNPRRPQPSKAELRRLADAAVKAFKRPHPEARPDDAPDEPPPWEDDDENSGP